MILILTSTCSDTEISTIKAVAGKHDLRAEVARAGERRVVMLSGGTPEALAEFVSLPGVERAVPLDSDRIGRIDEPADPARTLRIGDVAIGGGSIVAIAGPCSIESEEQALAIARSVSKAGARIFRGGAFKPRTSPYVFQGLGVEGLSILERVRRETGMLIATEALGLDSLEQVHQHADIIQIGSRNMQNTPLLRAVGRQEKPVILKRGMAATLDEWLMSAEYIFAGGNDRVILCERGVRTFTDHSRFTLDLGIIPALRERTGLPVIVDPSHGTGVRAHVPSMALAAIAGGADGIMVEVHHRPDASISDAPQAIDPEAFAALTDSLRRIAGALERSFD